MRRFWIIASIILAIVVIYYVVTSLDEFQKRQNEAASELGKSTGKKGGASMWGKMAGSFLDPGGFISGSGLL